MLYLRIAFLALLLMFACAAISQSTEPQVWFGQLCTASTGAGDKLVLPQAGSDQTVCVDRGQPRIDFENNSLRVTSYKWGGAALLLTCKSEERAAAFYKTGYMKEATFVVNGKALGVFTVAQPNMGCGWQQASNLAAATEWCAAIATAWGEAPTGCTMPCTLTTLTGSNGICVNSR